jgi:hypothetical protein
MGWILFAAVLLVLFLLVGWRSRRNRRSGPDYGAMRPDEMSTRVYSSLVNGRDVRARRH